MEDETLGNKNRLLYYISQKLLYCCFLANWHNNNIYVAYFCTS